jgi:hypothetical protein
VCEFDSAPDHRCAAFVNGNSLFLMKVVDGSLPMETVEEKLRELATSCIQECAKGNHLPI